MKNYDAIWRSFFAIALIAIAIQQLICGDLRPVILPGKFPSWFTQRLVLTWLFSLLFILAGIAIILKIKAVEISLTLGLILLLLILFAQIPYTFNSFPAQLGVWSDPLKELTLSGGAFIVANSFHKKNTNAFFRILEKIIPAAKYFVAITMFLFGIDHFLYTDFVDTLIPKWIPFPQFCTYFAGIALILAGIAIIINIQRKLAAILLGVMIFLWLIVLHIPRAIADPHSGNGNEWTSVFEALAFSGIAFLIAAQSNNVNKLSAPD